MFGKDSHTAPISLLEKGVLAEGALPAAGDCLQASCLCVLVQLQQDRKMVNEYLQLSLPYLKDSPASLRYEAVNFIGKPSPWVPLWALPWKQDTALQPPDNPCPCPDGCPAQVSPRAPSPPAAGEGKQLGWRGQGLHSWDCVGEWRSDGSSVPRAGCAALRGPK